MIFISKHTAILLFRCFPGSSQMIWSNGIHSPTHPPTPILYYSRGTITHKYPNVWNAIAYKHSTQNRMLLNEQIT